MPVNGCEASQVRLLLIRRFTELQRHAIALADAEIFLSVLIP